MRGFFMRRILIVLGLAVCLAAANEQSIGDVKLGDSFDSVLKKYAFLEKWGKQDYASLPYPLSVGRKAQVFLAQNPESRIYFYFDGAQKVIAIGLFNDNEYADNKLYETSAGLRPTDGLLEMKVAYGNPQDISEFEFKDSFGDKVVRRMYYYPDLIIQTRRVDALPEQIDNIIVCQYDMERVLLEKNYPLAKPGR